MNLVVNFDQNPATLPPGFVTAVDYVVGLFDSLFTTNVTVTINVGYGEIAGQRLPFGTLGASAQRSIVPVDYTTAVNALVAAGAPGASLMPSTPPPGAPSTLLMSTAQEKALGIIPNNSSVDGWVGFSAIPNTFSYAINAPPPPNEFYFVATVAHEFSEVMGRTSYLNLPQAYSLLDLYRYSAPGTPQFTTGSPAYFSIDGGITNINNFNNLAVDPFADLGDWASSAGNDAFTDVANPGVIEPLTQADLTVMAALGWGSNVASPTGPLQLVGTGSFYGDGTASIAWQQDGDVALWSDSGTQLNAQLVPNAAMGPEWTALDLADFNGDGLSDVLWTNGSGQVAIWLMAGSNLATIGIPAGAMGAEWQVGAAGDFSGDGNADILWHSLSGADVGQVSIWTMQGTSLLGVQTVNGSIGAEWTPVATGDFYQQGHDSILWQSDQTGNLASWALNGPTIVQLQNVGQMGSEWHVAGVGNFAGIGVANDPTGDIVWVNTNNDVQIWGMANGLLVQDVLPAGHNGIEWTLSGVGDFTGSGNSELLWLDSAGDAQIWQVNGTAVSVTPLSAPPGTSFVSSQAASPSSVSAGTQTVATGETVTDPVITDGTLQLAIGASVDGPITFAPGSTGTLYDASVADRPDTVVGFNEGADHLSFFGQNATTEAAVIASAVTSNGNTILTFPDQTSVMLAGVTHVDTGIFA